MLVEEAMFVAFGILVVLIAAPLAIGRRIFWLPRKDAAWHAERRKREAEVRLETLRVEKEAMEAEQQYARAVDEMIEDESTEEDKEREQRG